MLIFLLACTGTDGSTDKADGEGGFALSADAYVALPFISAGASAPSGTLAVHAVGERAATGPISLSVEGTFTVEGDTSALAAEEERTYTVRYTGDTSEPGIYAGSVTLRAEDDFETVDLIAVVGDASLGEASWLANGWGDQATLELASAPYPEGDASVLVFVPEGFTDRDAVGVVTHFHGWDTTLAEAAPAHRLVEQLAVSGRDAVLIVPQGPAHEDSGDFGQLMDPGGLALLVRDVLSVLYRDGYVTRPLVGDVALTAHAEGYEGAAAALSVGGLPISAVHLFDALYGEVDTFADYAEGGGVLRSSWTTGSDAETENAALQSRLTAAGVALSDDFADDALAAGTVTIGEVDGASSTCVRDDRAYARWLAASGLPHRPVAPPELLTAVSDGTSTTVTWLPDLGGDGLRYRVEGSPDGERWSLLTDTGETSATVDNSKWIRVITTDVRYGNSDPSDRYGATGADWLVVDGFDRVLDGSYRQPTHDFTAAVANGLTGTFSTVSNEAVGTGVVALSDYPRVLWLLGDESTADRTFDDHERASVESYVAGGGIFVVSGSEVGSATDPTWLADVLHASLVADDAGTTTVEGWTVGATYTEDSPDALAGEQTLWSWSTGAAAAVGWDGRAVVIGFGLENLSDSQRLVALESLETWLD